MAVAATMVVIVTVGEIVAICDTLVMMMIVTSVVVGIIVMRVTMMVERITTCPSLIDRDCFQWQRRGRAKGYHGVQRRCRPPAHGSHIGAVDQDQSNTHRSDIDRGR